MLKSESYIWILLEHQSTEDPWLPIRIFKYIGTIWEHLRKTSKTGKVPLIYPLIIYNGSRPYSRSLTLADQIESDPARRIFNHLFTSPFCLIDLPSIKDETLKRQAQDAVLGITLLISLKHIVDKNLQTYFKQVLVDEFKKLDKAKHRDDVADMLYYLLNEERFWVVMRQEFSSEIGDRIMTIIEKIEARAEPRAVGKNNIQIAKRLLAEGLKLDIISRITKLSLAKIKALQ